MASDPLAAVQHLQDIVTTLAPLVRPQVLPKGVTYGLDLIVSLCKTEEQRQTLVALVRRSQSRDRRDTTSSATRHEDEETTDQEEEGDDGKYWEPQVIGTFDVANRVFALGKVQWMHERDAVVHEFARLMELQLENPLAASQVTRHFLRANGHKPDDVVVAQRCFSAAFALQTLLRAFPRLPVALDGKLVEITEETDVAEVFAPLVLASTAKKHKSKAKPAPTQELVTKDNNMQQKRKKRKRT
ncbi:unnamed protein product [Hyaloperonospora brassicae]|uniref:Sister chromatid cohesion protein n=1 Tax=Hyaloperonospora brassicae TaxID=162125 RepID=A0AAV0T682_HYABA|nr:unnamed protein product [Hyaloperonospora brassicae]